jgi:hypothetical protein
VSVPGSIPESFHPVLDAGEAANEKLKDLYERLLPIALIVNVEIFGKSTSHVIRDYLVAPAQSNFPRVFIL